MKKDEAYDGLGKKLARWFVGRYYPGYSIYKTRPPTKGRVLKIKRYPTLPEAQDSINLMHKSVLAAVDSMDNPPPGYYEVGQVGESINPYVETVKSNEVKGE